MGENMNETPEQQIMKAIIEARKVKDLKPFKEALEEVLEGCEIVMRGLDFKVEMVRNAEDYERGELLRLANQYHDVMLFYNTMCKLYNMVETKELKLE